MIILAATPIGNIGDASPRLRETLANATVIAAEDTRRAVSLLKLLDIDHRPELIALHDHNEADRAPEVVARAEREDVVLVSDAGMPTISDPGFRVVQLAQKRGVTVSVIPGPSAVSSALAVSGLPTDRFTFEGFLPRKSGARAKALELLAEEPRTMVFFEAPGRIEETLRAMQSAFGGQRQATICRELTKLHEEVRRGVLVEHVEWAAAGVKGEIVIVVAGAVAQKVSLDAAVEMVRARLMLGVRLKDASREVAQKTGLSARDVYEATLESKRE